MDFVQDWIRSRAGTDSSLAIQSHGDALSLRCTVQSAEQFLHVKFYWFEYINDGRTAIKHLAVGELASLLPKVQNCTASGSATDCTHFVSDQSAHRWDSDLTWLAVHSEGYAGEWDGRTTPLFTQNESAEVASRLNNLVVFLEGPSNFPARKKRVRREAKKFVAPSQSEVTLGDSDEPGSAWLRTPLKDSVGHSGAPLCLHA